MSFAYRPKGSKLLLFLWMISLLGALYGVFSANLPLFLKILLPVFLFFYFLKAFRKNILLKGKNAIRSFTMNKDQWMLLTEEDQCHAAELCQKSFISRYLMCLTFKTHSHTYSIVLMPDSFKTRDHWRDLYVRITLQRGV